MKIVFGLGGRQTIFQDKTILEGIEAGPCYNPDQRLFVDGDTLVYEGQRYPFLYDGAYDAVVGTFGSREIADAAVVSYETTDERLKWYEVRADLVPRLSPAELRAEVASIEKIFSMEDGVLIGRSNYEHALLARAVSEGIISSETIARLRRADCLASTASSMQDDARLAIRAAALPTAWATPATESHRLAWVFVNLGRLDKPVWVEDADRMKRVRRRVEDALRKGIAGWESRDQEALILGLARLLGVKTE